MVNNIKWQNLLKNKCPKCGKDLDFESDVNFMLCTISCGFQISVLKMKAICGDMIKTKLKK